MPQISHISSIVKVNATLKRRSIAFSLKKPGGAFSPTNEKHGLFVGIGGIVKAPETAIPPSGRRGDAFSLTNFYPQRRPQMAHLTKEDRDRLERYLGKGLSFRTIAESLDKNSSTISREIRNHRILSGKTSENNVLNNCRHRFECKIGGLCQKLPTGCNGKCSKCRLVSCNELCRKFSLEECPRLVNAPYVCNGCRHERQCA